MRHGRGGAKRGDEWTKWGAPGEHGGELRRGRWRRASRGGGGRSRSSGLLGGARRATVGAASDTPAAGAATPGGSPRPQGGTFHPHRQRRARRPAAAPVTPAGGRTPTPGSKATGRVEPRQPDRSLGGDAIPAHDGAPRGDVVGLSEVRPDHARRASGGSRQRGRRGEHRRAGRGRGSGRGLGRRRSRRVARANRRLHPSIYFDTYA